MRLSEELLKTRTTSENALRVMAVPRGGVGLRIALFSGNYNCIRDGANNALNRLVAYLLKEGAAVRVYSPTVPEPAFAPAGELVSVPSVSIPRRSEYRLALGLPRSIRDDILRFNPTHFHLSAPDILGIKAQSFARKIGVPVVTSLHTRFETYFKYYGLRFAVPAARYHLKRFYGRSNFVLVPNKLIADEFIAAGFGDRVRVWSRGVDHNLFSPHKRDPLWRSTNGYGQKDVVPFFFGRLVMEKGIDIFAAIMSELRRRGHTVRPLIIGDGPARQWAQSHIPDGVFTSYLSGEDLARAVASADILINPSVTEAFGNVNLEAMASGVAIISADVASAQALIDPGKTGLLIPSADACVYADAVEQLIHASATRKKLAAAATKAAAAYNWSDILRGVLDVYRVQI